MKNAAMNQLIVIIGIGEMGSVFACGPLPRSYLNPAATLLAWRFITFHWSLLIGAPVFLFLMGRRPSRPNAGLNAHSSESAAQSSINQLV